MTLNATDIFQIVYCIIAAISYGGFLISVVRSDGMISINAYTIIGGIFLGLTWPIWGAVFGWLHLLMWWEKRRGRWN